MWDHATAPHFGSGVAAGAAAPGGAPFIKIGGCSGFGAPNVKFTLIVVSTSVGTPSTRYGLYFHRCTASIAAGSALTEWMAGRTVAEIACFNPSMVDDAVGGLAAESKHAAALCFDAVKLLLKGI